MESAHLKAILTDTAQATEKDGWYETQEGKTMTLYANHNGSGVSAQKVHAVREQGELVHARTTRGETYVMYLSDVYAMVVEGTNETSKRRAGFGG